MFTPNNAVDYKITELHDKVRALSKFTNKQTWELYWAKYYLRMARLCIAALSITLVIVLYLWWTGTQLLTAHAVCTL